jgi:hypothetical protein
MLAYHSAEIALYKVGLSKPSVIPESSMSSLQRIELLCACQSSVLALFDTFLSIPLLQLECITLPIYVQLAQAFTTLIMFSTFEHDGWDSCALSQTMAICEIPGKLADRFEAAIATLGLDQNDSGEDHLFYTNVKKLRWLQEFYRGKLLDKSAVDLNQQTPSSIDVSNTAYPFLPNEEPLSLVDEAWLSEMMGPWDHYQDLSGQDYQY